MTLFIMAAGIHTSYQPDLSVVFGWHSCFLRAARSLPFCHFTLVEFKTPDTLQQKAQGRDMRNLLIGALVLAWPATAQAQEEQHTANDPSGDLVKAVTIQDMRALAEAEGHEIGIDLESDIGISALDDDGLNYVLRGRACQTEESCLGLEMMVMFQGDFTTEFANSINERYSAIKATRADGALLLSRYLILDGGQTRENLGVNLRNTLAIAANVQNESEAEGNTTSNTSPPAPQEQISSELIAWGDDSGPYANDDACDDGRFHEDGDDWSYQRNHVLKDATDCRTLYEAGEITLYLDFGSNSGDYVNDETCDDNRFTGEGRSILQTDSQVKRDADDCIAAYRADTLNRP
jgi:hypothetical protein